MPKCVKRSATFVRLLSSNRSVPTLNPPTNHPVCPPFPPRVLLSPALRFWRRLGRLMSKLNPKPNLIHIMGCYVLGSANGEKVVVLFVGTNRDSHPPVVSARVHLKCLHEAQHLSYAHTQTHTKVCALYRTMQIRSFANRYYR